MTAASPHSASWGMSCWGNPRMLAMTRWGSGRANRLMNSTLTPSVVDPVVDQLMGMSRDHLPVAQRADADPRVGELSAMLEIQFLRRPERDHRRLHQIVVLRIRLLRREPLVDELTDPHGGHAPEACRILHDRGDIAVLRQHERVGARREATALRCAGPAGPDGGSRRPRTSVPGPPRRTGRRPPGVPGIPSGSARGSRAWDTSSCAQTSRASDR